MLLDKINELRVKKITNKFKKQNERQQEYKEKYTFVGLDRAPEVRKDPLYEKFGVWTKSKKELLAMMHVDASTESINRRCNCSFSDIMCSSLGRPLTGNLSATNQTIPLTGWLAEAKDSKYIEYLKAMKILSIYELADKFWDDKDAAVCFWILNETQKSESMSCEDETKYYDENNPDGNVKRYYRYSYDNMISNAFDYLISREHKDLAKRDAMEKEILQYWTVKAKELDLHLKRIGKNELLRQMHVFMETYRPFFNKEQTEEDRLRIRETFERENVSIVNHPFLEPEDMRIVEILKKYVPESVLLYSAPRYRKEFDTNLNLDTF